MSTLRRLLLSTTVAATGVGLAAGMLVSCVPAQARTPYDLHALRHCETGDNYTMHTWVGGREYAGAYGFDTIYWRALGYPGVPQNAAPWVQDNAIVDMINANGIRNSNPGCAAKLGYR